MKLSSNDLQDGERISTSFAFGKRGPDGRFAPSDNLSPHLAWSEAPEGTQSFVVMVWDPDVPSSGEDVNQDGKTVPYELPRVPFTHLVLVDLPRSVNHLLQGALSRGIVAKGKDPDWAPIGRTGKNDYTSWFEGDAEMGGTYTSYDGPCPPWNDERLHRYYFEVFALDLPRLEVKGRFTRDQVLKAMEGHVLDRARITGTYALYAEARA